MRKNLATVPFWISLMTTLAFFNWNIDLKWWSAFLTLGLLILMWIIWLSNADKVGREVFGNRWDPTEEEIAQIPAIYKREANAEHRLNF